MKQKIKVSEHDMYILLGSTLRYSMGRMSVMPSYCQDFLKKYAPALDVSAIRSYIRDLEAELRRAVSEKQTLGMQIDHDMWVETLEFLTDLLDNKEEEE